MQKNAVVLFSVEIPRARYIEGFGQHRNGIYCCTTLRCCVIFFYKCWQKFKQNIKKELENPAISSSAEQPLYEWQLILGWDRG